MTSIDAECFPPEVAFSGEMFEECLTGEEFQGWGVESAGRLIAFAIVLWAGPRVGQIITIDVLPGHRRAGIGNTLMAEIERAARERALRRMVLQVDIDNKDAMPLYQKWGYRIKSLLPDYYGPGRDAYMMDKQIGA